jgi:hypothetical protein
MSDLKDFGFSPKKAAHFNQRGSEKIWNGGLPEAVLEAEPQLRNDPGSVAFAEGVHDLQKILFPDDEEDWDGKMGRGTYRALLRKYDTVEESQNYLVYNGRRLLLPEGRDYEVINFDQAGGFDLHREGDWSRGRKKGHPITFLGLHWAGGVYSARRLYNIFENAVFNEKGVIIEDPRNVSSHGAIEFTKSGKVRVYQYIDLWHRTWHGGQMNTRSCGWDLLWDPRKKYYERSKEWGWDVEWVKNPTKPRRGDRWIGSMDPRYARGVRQFLDDHLAALKLGEALIPLGEDGLQTSGTPFDGVLPKKAFKTDILKANIVGHSSSNPEKEDIACYVKQLFPEFYV